MKTILRQLWLAALIGLALVTVPDVPARADPAEDRADLLRTWDQAWVFAPAANGAGYRRLSVSELADYLREAGPPSAVVIYLHGCDGLSEISAAAGRFLARAGYLVVAPDSFARLDKPKSCDPARHQGGLHRGVLAWRQAEALEARDALRGFPALAGVPLVLMGHSEGAITTATLPEPGFDARVIEGWTCHAGWPEYRGLAAPVDEPVLALVGADDPWFTHPQLQGDCGAFMAGRVDAQSLVYAAPGYLHDKHWLSSDREVQATILAFLAQALAR